MTKQRVKTNSIAVKSDAKVCCVCFCDRVVDRLNVELIDMSEELAQLKQDNHTVNEDIDFLKRDIIEVKEIIRDAKIVSTRIFGGTHMKQCSKGV